jgi:heterodisulfide reductase subunit D
LTKYSLAFRALEIIALTVFGFGVLANFWFWFKGSLSRTSGGNIPAKLAYLIKALCRAFRPSTFFRIAFPEIFLQRKLTKEDVSRWIMHFSVFVGFCILFFIGSLGNYLADLGLISLKKDTPWFAFINDLAGILLLFGLLILILRRFILKFSFLKTFLDDKIIVITLLVSLASGYFAEGFRLLAEGVDLETNASFIGVQLARIFSPLNLEWQTVHNSSWWFHAVVSLGLVAYIPYSKLFHIFATPLIILINSTMKANELTGIPPADKKIPNLTVKQLIELSACMRCGACLRVCETYKMRSVDPIAPALKLKDFRAYLLTKYLPGWIAKILGGKTFEGEKQDPQTGFSPLKTFAEGAYRCTTCGHCTVVCPAKIDLVSLWQSIREELADKKLYPKGFELMQEAIATERNVVNYPNVERSMWVDFMDNPPEDGFIKPKAKVVYYVGCMSSFSPAIQAIPQTYCKLLLKAGIDFTIMGSEEWCCGFPLVAAGMKSQMAVLKEHNIKKVKEIGADTIVFNCPSCSLTWIKEYAPELKGVRLMHSTVYLEELLREKKLQPKHTPLVVTYHDPCDLGRNYGIYDAPRNVIKSIPGVELREIKCTRETAVCCGGGGDLQITDDPLATEIAVSSYNKLSGTGADAIITACPQCTRMFITAKTKVKGKAEVLDILQLVLKAVT